MLACTIIMLAKLRSNQRMPYTNVNTTIPYPAERLVEYTEALAVLTTDRSRETLPLRINQNNTALDAIFIPLHHDSDVNQDLANIITIISSQHVKNVIFLCGSAVSMKSIVAHLPASSATQWTAITGDFKKYFDEVGLSTPKSKLAYGKHRDISEKRNFAISLSKKMNWDSIMFLDGDIHITDRTIRLASELMQSSIGVVGFRANEFPDHSALSHIYRELVGELGTFIGSGAMAIKITNEMPFFPTVYNEDWLFMLPYTLIQDGISYAGEVIQSRYDPFRVTDHHLRAYTEEVGEILAESLFNLCIQLRKNTELSSSVFDAAARIHTRADRAYWDASICHRLLFTREMLDTVNNSDDQYRAMLTSINASSKHYTDPNIADAISTDALEEWLTHWKNDIIRWNTYLGSLPHAHNLHDAISSYSVPFKMIGFYTTVERADRVVQQPAPTKNTLKTTPLQSRTVADGVNFSHYIQTSILQNNDIGRISHAADTYEIVALSASQPVRIRSSSFLAITLEYNADIEAAVHAIQKIVSGMPHPSNTAIVLWVFGDSITRSQYQIYMRMLVGRLLTTTTCKTLPICIPAQCPGTFNEYKCKTIFDDLLLFIWKNDMRTARLVQCVNMAGEILYTFNRDRIEHVIQGVNEHRLDAQPAIVNASHSLTNSQNSIAKYIIGSYDYPHLSTVARAKDYVSHKAASYNTARLSRQLKKLGLNLTQTDILHYNLLSCISKTEVLVSDVKRLYYIDTTKLTDLKKFSELVEVELRRASRLPSMVVIVAQNSDHTAVMQREVEKLLGSISLPIIPRAYIYDLSLVQQIFPGKYTRGGLVLVLRFYFWLFNHKRWLFIRKVTLK